MMMNWDYTSGSRFGEYDYKNNLKGPVLGASVRV
jgi:hypothetical protein